MIKIHDTAVETGTYSMKPETKESIDRFVLHGIPPGGFVTAVLANNLMESVRTADEQNMNDLAEICRYVHWEIPANCHGSMKTVNDWIQKKFDEREIMPAEQESR